VGSKQLKFEWEPIVVQQPTIRTVAAEWNHPLAAALKRSEEDLHPPVEGREMTLEEELGW